MIKKYIFYSQVEDKDFHKFIARYLLKTVNAEMLLSYFGNTIQNCILNDYYHWKAYIYKKILGIVSSIIYLSFNLLTTPNNSAYIDVIIYFLDTKKELYIVILVIQNIYKDYSRKIKPKLLSQ